MFSSLETLRQIVCHDLDPDFVESVSIGAAWGYASLYEQLAAEPELPDMYRLEQFGRRRGSVVVTALKRAAEQHRVPYDFVRLECNGQYKFIVKIGRVLLIQEPITALDDCPKPADYKVKLANIHGLIHQLELQLGDLHQHKIRDWSGCVLGVLLHGASGTDFTLEHRALGGLMLGVTDSAYSQWVLRLDLHKVAMWGRSERAQPDLAEPRPEEPAEQPDNVEVTPKRKPAEKRA